MLSLRTVAAVLAVFSLDLALGGCGAPGGGAQNPGGSGTFIELEGVKTDDLTQREKHEWSSAVRELLAPCPDQAVSIAQCVQEKRACAACTPAAELLARQIRKGKSRSQMDAAYKKRFGPEEVRQIPIAGSPSKGPENAPVQLVEFADFECSACGRAAPRMEQILGRYKGQTRLVFKNYPLPKHKHADKAARAAMAADRQGKFWEMHAALFELQPEPPDDRAIDKIARAIKLDPKKFSEDLASPAMAEAVARDRKHGDDLKVRSTPSLFINGRHYDLDYFDLGEDLDDWIKTEVKLRGGAP